MPDVQDQKVPWEGCFMQLVRTHITRDPLEFDDRILRLPIVKEAQARLDARRIPHHPLEFFDFRPHYDVRLEKKAQKPEIKVGAVLLEVPRED